MKATQKVTDAELSVNGRYVMGSSFGPHSSVEIKSGSRTIGVLSVNKTDTISLDIEFIEAATGHKKEVVSYSARVVGHTVSEYFRSRSFSYKANKRFIERLVTKMEFFSPGLSNATDMVATSIIEAAKEENVSLGIKTTQPSKALIHYMRLFAAKVIYTYNGEQYTLDLDARPIGQNALANKYFNGELVSCIKILSSLVYFGT